MNTNKVAVTSLEVRHKPVYFTYARGHQALAFAI